MDSPVHGRIEGCLLDWVVPQADVDWWDATKQRYVEAGRADEAPRGEWLGMRAETRASWDSSMTLRWELDDIDLSRDMYPLRLDAVAADRGEMGTRNIGYFASQAEARLFAAALLLADDRPSLDEALREEGFALQKGDAAAARWERRLKSGDLSLRIDSERGRPGGRRHDRALHLTYHGDKARRAVPIVDSCAAWGGSGVDDPDRAPHPATGAVADPFAADVLAAVVVADARLALGNIRKPLDDGQEVAFIAAMVARRGASPEEPSEGMRLG